MSRWILCPVVIFSLAFALAALTLAQEGEDPEQPATDETAEPEEGDAPSEAATFTSDNWRGEIYHKRAGAEEYEILAPVDEETATLHFGDAVATGEGASVTLTLVDGTVIELGPESEIVFEESPDGLIVARLIYGSADVIFGSDQFRFVCARNTISGAEGTCVRVSCPDPNTVGILGVDDTATVTNDYGLVILLDPGQHIESTYLEGEGVFQVTVNEYNEIGLRVEVGDEGKMIDPGLSFTVDSDLNFQMFGRVQETPEDEAVVLRLPLELEKPEDEPFEDSGDLESIYVVSPIKP
jgi:hypothetical protein